MKRLRIAAISLCQVILLMLLLNSCNAADKFEDYVLAGNYEDAVIVYRDKISGNTEKEQTAQDFMWTYVNNILTDYAEGNIDAESAISAFNCISEINANLSVLGSNFYYLYDELNSLQASKRSFEEAVMMADSKDYETAAEIFATVNEIDIQNYEEARTRLNWCNEMIYQDVNSVIDQYVSEGKYELALKMYDKFSLSHAELTTNELQEKVLFDYRK